MNFAVRTEKGYRMAVMPRWWGWTIHLARACKETCRRESWEVR